MPIADVDFLVFAVITPSALRNWTLYFTFDYMLEHRSDIVGFAVDRQFLESCVALALRIFFEIGWENMAEASWLMLD